MLTGLDQSPNLSAGCFEQRILMEQVLVGIGGNAELREESNRSMCLGCSFCEFQRAVSVVCRVCHPQRWNADRYADEAMGINRIKTLHRAHSRNAF